MNYLGEKKKKLKSFPYFKIQLMGMFVYFQLVEQKGRYNVCKHIAVGFRSLRVFVVLFFLFLVNKKSSYNNNDDSHGRPDR